MNSAVVVFRISEDRQDFIGTDINRAAEIRKYYSESSRRVFSEQIDFKSSMNVEPSGISVFVEEDPFERLRIS